MFLQDLLRDADLATIDGAYQALIWMEHRPTALGHYLYNRMGYGVDLGMLRFLPGKGGLVFSATPGGNLSTLDDNWKPIASSFFDHYRWFGPIAPPRGGYG